MLFSIVIPYYDQWVKLSELIRCLDSLKQQRFKDFEVLLYHDGPLNTELPEDLFNGLNLKFISTKKHYNDWGHSLRDLGIRAAKGYYIVHLNADNVLYNDCLAELNYYISDTGVQDVYVMKTVMVKSKEEIWGKIVVSDVLAPKPKDGFIDCMQLVMSTDKWLSIGGWYDKSKNSDGTMYEQILQEELYVMIPTIMGEHH